MTLWKPFYSVLSLIFLIMGMAITILELESRLAILSLLLAIFSAVMWNHFTIRDLIENRVATWNVNGDGK